jgi:hypothetical protein
MIPNVDERIGDMSEMRNKVCERLPPNHPFQSPMIQPLNFIPADADVIGEHIGSESSNPNPESSSSHPSSTTQTPGTSILENLVSHYSGELPGVEPNLQRASEVASMEVALEIPQQQAPNAQMASIIHPIVPVPEQVASEHTGSEQTVPEQAESLAIPETVSEPDFMITSEASDYEDKQSNSSSNVVVKSVSDQPSTANTQTQTSTNS